MRVQVAGRQVELGEALKTRIAEDLERGVEKYFSSRPADAVVTVGRDGPFFQVDCALHLDSGISLQAEGRGGDAHAAFEDALVKIEKRVRRYKRRLKNHQAQNKIPLPAETVAAFVLAPTPEDEEDATHGLNGAAPDAPLIIAETTTAVKTMPVSMAVLELDMGEAPALIFRNAAHGGLNLVYRRSDGNVGWVDPEGPERRKTAP